MSLGQSRRDKLPRACARGWRWMGEQIARMVGSRRVKPSELVAIAKQGFRAAGFIAYGDDVTNAIAEVDGTCLRYSKGEWYAVSSSCG